MKAVIFDMDGVMVNSEEHWLKAEYKHFKSIIPSWNEEKQKKIMGLSLANLYKHITLEHNVKVKKTEFYERYHDLAKTLYGKKVRLYLGILPLLQKCRKEKLKLAVCSSSPLPWITIVLERFRIAHYFDVIVSADLLKGKAGKPAPDIYLITAKKLNVKPEDCIVIEDSEHGIASAKAAGMKCIAIARRHNKNQNLAASDFQVNSFRQASILLNQ